ncbi:MAG: hypothetical protein HKN89_05130 [Eudoraea sp.]|nr:hypothetical protein [Eudoraea sp.]
MRKQLLKFQGIHVFFLILLLACVYLITDIYPKIRSGSLWGITTQAWLFLALLVPILHQVYVLLCWRLELFGKRLSAWFGEPAFTYYKRGFTILILARPLTIIPLAIANKQTLNLDPVLALVLSIVLLIPAIYLFYSVKRFFGFDRAFGIDHFEPEKYRDIPLVNKGIFKYTDNGMYTFGFLILYLPALIWFSKAALVVAIFQHLYIWVHHFFTEKPDMDFIYGEPVDHK